MLVNGRGTLHGKVIMEIRIDMAFMELEIHSYTQHCQAFSCIKITFHFVLDFAILTREMQGKQKYVSKKASRRQAQKSNAVHSIRKGNNS